MITVKGKDRLAVGLALETEGGGEGVRVGSNLRVFFSLGNEQPVQNWYGQGESDCLIKTKHCDGLN